MTSVVVAGACGRMGSEVCRALAGQFDMKLVGGVEALGHPLVGTRCGEGAVTDNLSTLLPQADVVVDFSIPAAVAAHARACADAGCPYVVGVTGLTEEAATAVSEAARRVPVVYAPNFSVGIAVLNQLVAEAAKLLTSDYDINIVETHHRFKRDAPSGTARLLAATVQKARPDWSSDRVISLRAGDVVGEHLVIFAGQGERVELGHKAESRMAFAAGVIAAVRFVLNRPPGLYSMADVLGLQQT